MKRFLVKYRRSAFSRFIQRHQKSAPVIFFIGGFIFDSLTLGRIDRLYDMIVLCSHMTLVSITLYLFNVADDGKWKGTFLERFETYLPLAIQFFFGALSSAYVIYFSRSVSLSKTTSFFIILVILLFANEFLKQRISNKNLQFSVYFFISFTFFTFMVPVFIKEMNPNVFLISGAMSLGCTLFLILFIYKVSPTTRAEVKLPRLLVLIFGIYITINIFYYFKLIPPVPLALNHGIVAHNIENKDHKYFVTFEKRKAQHIFWREHRLTYAHRPGERVYVFSSVFAPTELEKYIIHRWKWYNPKTEEWEIVEDIGYDIQGGRDEGFRGYTYKANVKEGEWKVEVITNEELILGVIDFVIVNDGSQPKHLVTKKF
ncbi:DUF2914 domain-containing protein [Mangrovimonas sp. ST2L15]|uniref:DUF2914 domain-containing protein n=1 Tax=Mangrovimonas sp. ST2L15 TaxID=1645916 RepID=UPI0006B58673|nr:DUF2914 domain-containing protein [Mangrovimonas sp. ST2L15]